MNPAQIQHGGEPEAYFRRYGLGPRPLLDFSVNLSPLGLPEVLRRGLAGPEVLEPYPERYGAPLAGYYAQRYGLDRARVLPLNGSIEGIYLWAAWKKPKCPLLAAPGFGDYQAAVRPFAEQVKTCALQPPRFELSELEQHLPGCDACLVGSPHNPTGTALDRDQWRALVRRWPQVDFLVDQAFLGLSDDPAQLSLMELSEPNLYVLHSLTKEFACAGLRLGALILPRPEAERWMQTLPPWRLSGPALDAAVRLTEAGDYGYRLRGLLDLERPRMARYLASHARLEAAPSRANFFWVAYAGDLDQLLRRALEAGLFLRDGRSFEGYGQASYFRLGLKGPAENHRLIEFFDELT